jgi:hypothetical protein
MGELVRPEPGPYWYRAVFSLTFQALVFGNPMWVMRSTETIAQRHGVYLYSMSMIFRKLNLQWELIRLEPEPEYGVEIFSLWVLS